MRKGIIAILIGLALLVLISPGLIGRLAERSLDENIRVGTVETEGLIVSAQSFQRGWFTTEGEHRIDLKEGTLAKRYRQALGFGPDEPLPTLIVNTRIDHGVIPLSSMTREDGSLTPGLGDAISTLRIEMPDGKVIDLPGVVNSSVGFTGSMRSEYALPAGAMGEPGNRLAWGEGFIEVETEPAGNRMLFDVRLDSLAGSGDDLPITISGLSIEGEQYPSGHGFLLGGATVRIASIERDGAVIGPLEIDAAGDIVEDSVTLDFAMDVESVSAGGGPTRVAMDLQLSAIEPPVFRRFVRRPQELLANAVSPDTARPLLVAELRRFVAGGMALDLEQLDVDVLNGRIESSFDVDIEPRDDVQAPWSAVLLATRASGVIRLTEPLVEALMAMHPDAAGIVGMGYLKQEDDRFVSEIEFAKGILTINGAPMTIPLAVP